jgi:uncharacterized protein (TIGR02145 family)
MKTKMTIFTLLASVAICYAQAVNISGVVKNSAGTGIDGAMVRLGKADLSTTTSSGGSFTLTGNLTGIMHQTNLATLPGNLPFILKDNRLIISIKEQTEITVKVYDCNGRLFVSLGKVTSAKDHAIALPCFACGIYIYRISINNNRYIFKSIVDRAANRIQGPSWNMIAPARQAKAAVSIDDALLFTKTGYQLYRLPIKKPDTSGIQATMTSLVTGTVSDGEGNSYQTVQFGKQTWTIENIRATKYNNGSGISQSDYSFYKNTTDAAAKKKWGALYSASAALSGKLAPTGWHVSTDADWDTLQNYLITNGYNYDGTMSGNKIAKSMAQTTDWQTFTEAGAVGKDLSKNNASGFSALPGGTHYFDGTFFDQNVIGYWWTSTARDGTYTWSRLLYYTNFDLYKSYRVNTNSFSVRLVKNN